MSIELLAPGGSLEGLHAAVMAGADAVYMGGQKFGARAYAQNPDTEEYLRAIDYCHIQDVKLYLTVNTLLKEEELLGQLYDYILPLYERGLDGVLVQDLGVLRYLRREFPDLPLHASTQMSVQSPDGARLLKSLGACRIVPARELTLQEIRRIRRETDLEIETFVHGAMCYSYSGQCLMSSMIGGRSGNRGRCAQPCRQMYTLSEEGGAFLSKDARYLLSMKDMSALGQLPDLIDAGIASLKIEGRMKRPEYAAGVVSIYRKYLDLYEKEGRDAYRVEEEDLRKLMDLYNRGGFSGGYYKVYNGPSLMSMDRQNHAGTKAARVVSTQKNGLLLKALEELYEKDLVSYQEDMLLKTHVREGETFTLPRRIGAKAGDTIRRLRSEHLLEEIRALSAERPRVRVSGYFTAYKHRPMMLSLQTESGIAICVEGDSPDEAKNRSVSAADIEKQLKKTGGTAYYFADLTVDAEDGLFIPMAALNTLRRRALEALEEEILKSYRREPIVKAAGESLAEAGPQVSDRALTCRVFVREIEQLSSVLSFEAADEVLLDSLIYLDGRSKEDIQTSIQRIKRAGKRCLVALPPVWREKAREAFDAVIGWKAALSGDGLLLRCLDEIGAVQEAKQYLPADKDFCMEADHNLYAWNTEARRAFMELGLTRLTLPLELNRAELSERGVYDDTMILYGRAPLMTSAQCHVKNTVGCRHQNGRLYLTDKMKAVFPAAAYCGICTNVIYNSLPLDLSDVYAQIRSLGVRDVRLDLLFETEEELSSLWQRFGDVFAGKEPCEKAGGTRGHYKRGVE